MSHGWPEDQPDEDQGSAASSSTPDISATERTNWTPVYAAIAIVVALTIVTVLWLNRPQAGVSGPPPSTVPTPSASPTPSPTPDPREAEIAAAQEVYEKYSDAVLAMAKAGGSEKATENVHRYTSGQNWKDIKLESTDYRNSKLKITGNVRVHFNRASDIQLEPEKPSMTLRVCIDQRDVVARDVNGKKVNPTWIRSEVVMEQLESMWRVTERVDKVEDESCIA